MHRQALSHFPQSRDLGKYPLLVALIHPGEALRAQGQHRDILVHIEMLCCMLGICVGVARQSLRPCYRLPPVPGLRFACPHLLEGPMMMMLPDLRNSNAELDAQQHWSMRPVDHQGPRPVLCWQ